MRPVVFGASIQGSTHKHWGVECQDSMKWKDMDHGTVIMAVADGHGSKMCPYSKSGSKIAVNVFCKEVENLCNAYVNDQDKLMTLLKRDGDTKIAQQIHTEWKKRVRSIHRKMKRDIPTLENRDEVEQAIYLQYGTTLLGVLITPSFVFGLQIGDGDIIFIDENNAKEFITTDKILGTETHSLSKTNAWVTATSLVSRRDALPKKDILFWLSTDGFSNSYSSNDEFLLSCKSYYDFYRKFGLKVFKINVKSWLEETSMFGSGDDVTLLMTYL